MPKIDLTGISPCVCGVYDFPHIHCGNCGKPIAIDHSVHENTCDYKGFHPDTFELTNDWCTCSENHVEKFVAKNSCSCGCAHAHAHCLGCGKIKDGSVRVE